MTARRRLDRKARIAISVAVTLVLAGPILAMRNCVSNLESQNGVVAPVHPPADGLFRLKNDATLFLQDGSVSRKVAAWLALNTEARPAFEIADTNFVPSTAELTRQGRKNIAQVAQILKAEPGLTAKIVFSDELATDGRLHELGQSRASRLLAELIQQQVPPSKVSSAIDSSAVSDDSVDRGLDGQSHLFVILSR